MTYLPGSASVFGAPAVVPNSAFGVVWLGLAAGAAAASVTFWRASGSDGGASPLATMQTPIGTTTPMWGPFSLNASGLYVGGITTGSAVVWLRRRGG